MHVHMILLFMQLFVRQTMQSKSANNTPNYTITGVMSL